MGQVENGQSRFTRHLDPRSTFQFLPDLRTGLICHLLLRGWREWIKSQAESFVKGGAHTWSCLTGSTPWFIFKNCVDFKIPTDSRPHAAGTGGRADLCVKPENCTRSRALSQRSGWEKGGREACGPAHVVWAAARPRQCLPVGTAAVTPSMVLLMARALFTWLAFTGQHRSSRLGWPRGTARKGQMQERG